MIKFRIYCYETQEMLVARDYRELAELFAGPDADGSIYSDLMQSTGLLDKNDKEIFEFDLVELEHKDTGQLVRGIIKYDTELGFCGMTDVRFNDLTAIGYLANQKVTVLSNIYENKELVEVQYMYIPSTWIPSNPLKQDNNDIDRLPVVKILQYEYK